MEEREGKNEPIKHGHITQPVGGVWATRGQRAPLAVGPTTWATRGLLATFASRALPHVLQPYLRHPNSDFEFIF